MPVNPFKWKHYEGERFWCKNNLPQFDTIILTFVYHFPDDENN